MTVKKTITLCAAGLTLAGSMQADRIYFTGQGGDDNWTNTNNWVYYKSNPARSGVPNDLDEARPETETTVRITSAVTVGYLKVGIHATSRVIIDGGSLVTKGTSDYNCADYNSRGSIIVKNGGSAIFNSRFFVGYLNATGGSLVIHDGTVRVANTFTHNKDYYGTEIFNTRTTISPGGLLDVNELMINSGAIDIAGGALVVRLDKSVDKWIASGRIIAMGGSEDWQLKVTVDADTGWITIVAERATE